MALHQNKRSTDIGGPWWLGAIYKVGVPAAICCYLVWFLVTKVDVKSDKIVDGVADHNKLMIAQGYETSYYLKEQKNLTEMQLGLMRQMLNLMQQQCINTAATAERSTRECLK